MQIRTTLERDALMSIIRATSDAHYGGNVTIECDVNTRNDARTYRVKLGARDSRGVGARRSWSGRRGPWACWHVFRDVLAAIFLADPNAVAHTAFATYRGAASFLELFPATADTNAGSIVAPQYMPEMCDCDGPDVGGPLVELLEATTSAVAA